MKHGMITFRSVTYAQRGESLLRGAGIRCRLRRTPRWMENRGCGYCLELDARGLPGAVALLREQGASFRRVYTGGEGGHWEEATP